MEALDRREWPRTEHETRMLRSCMFTAQAIARDMIAAGRRDEVEGIRQEISKIVPDLQDNLSGLRQFPTESETGIASGGSETHEQTRF